MSQKRSRAAFESDNHAPFAVFGTPLPDEADSRDDGSYLPLWKQDVRDEKGRRRLHGAFTGGWSAGYFNTVGSKEGWAPSTFKSSRTSRHKDGATPAQQRAEDYMDDEDLADAAEAQKLQTTQAFAGLGSSTQNDAPLGGLRGLLRARGDTMGLQLLRRMGWKDGQGIGPKVRRSARLDVDRGSAFPADETYLFAPENAPMIRFVRKTDRKGLGHRGEGRLQGLDERGADDDDDGQGNSHTWNSGGAAPEPRPGLGSGGRGKQPPSGGGFGVGVLNDTGSDEDPYDIGPKISYNRIAGGQKKKKNKKATSAVINPTLANAPKFVPKTARAGNSLRRCHDGRLPLDGFVLAKLTEDFAALFSQHRPPPVPPGWKSARYPSATPDASRYVSTADAAKASSLDPRSRAAMLGEKSLPGKSVFDYLSVSTRDKLAAASGKSNLPLARGEVLAQNTGSMEERVERLWDRVAKLDRNSAAAALSRVAMGPYADDESKRARYRRYLEHQSNPGLPRPEKTEGTTDEDFLREMSEFYECARIFKPMTGFMASRFTTSRVTSDASGGAAGAEPPPLQGPKVVDTAAEAARMGMFGHLTRSVEPFFPSPLLCKRFNVKAPAHSRPDAEPEKKSTLAEAWSTPAGDAVPAARGEARDTAADSARKAEAGEVDPERNEALEKDTANAGVLRAIFGDSDTASETRIQTAALSGTRDPRNGPSESSLSELEIAKAQHRDHARDTDSEPPQYPVSDVSTPPRPPPFSSLFAPFSDPGGPSGKAIAHDVCASASLAAAAAPAYTYKPSPESEPFDPDQATARAFHDPVAETKSVLPRDTKGESSKAFDAEPPPAYSEGDSPLQSFTYVMSAAGGASSIITQVQQGGPPINAIGDVGADEPIAMDLRGTRFVLSRDELLTLPEFVLLSLFPNGLFPEGHMTGLSENDAVQVDYDPASLQYMLEFFRNVAQSIPSEPSPTTSHDGEAMPVDSLGSRDDSSKRAGIIVLREDLDFYAIPPRADISQPDMIKVKRAAALALQLQDGIFSGLKRSDEPGTTEAHLIEMLTAGGFNHDDRWGHRAGEPNKAVICSMALARLRSDVRGNDLGTSAVGMAQKLLLFWRKPARRCWWEGIELDNIEGVEGKLKVWIRRVWTLEMSVIGLR